MSIMLVVKGYHMGTQHLRFLDPRLQVRILSGVKKLHEFAEVAQLVEHHLAMVGVAGSSPVFRSKTRGS